MDLSEKKKKAVGRHSNDQRVAECSWDVWAKTKSPTLSNEELIQLLRDCCDGLLSLSMASTPMQSDFRTTKCQWVCNSKSWALLCKTRTWLVVSNMWIIFHFIHGMSSFPADELIFFKMFFLTIIELDDGKIYRKPLYLMVKTMVSCRFSL